MKQGSQSGYDAETGEESAGSESTLGEPHERPSLYRIGRPQENYQLLHQDGGGRARGRRQDRCAAGGTAALGFGANSPLAGSAGGDAVQQLDLRHPQALWRAVGNGTSGQDESHLRGQEEERHDRRAHHRRPSEVQPVARLLRGSTANPRTAAPVALSLPGGERSGADEEQDGRSADGNRRGVCEGKTTPEEVLRHPAGGTRRSAGISDRSAAPEPRGAGDVRGHAEAAGARVARRSRVGAARGTADEHTRGGRDHGLDLGAGGWRSATLPLVRRCHELLRTDRGAEVIGRKTAARADLQAAQPLVANHAHRGRQARTTMEPATSRLACPRAGTRTSQSRHAGGGAQTGGLSAGGGQKRAALPGASAARRNGGNRCLRDVERVSDPPAVPRRFGDWAEESRLPMLAIVCIEAGRKTLTHTSWTETGSRKWMSGQAAALAATQDRGQFANLNVASPLRDHPLPSGRRPPSPLDFYLSWMSPSFPGFPG